MKHRLTDRIRLVDFRILKVHAKDACSGEFCSVHRPSDHPLNSAPFNWRDDRGLLERVCSHGTGHPDPDDLAHKRRVMDPEAYQAGRYDAHGCDGCCEG